MAIKPVIITVKPSSETSNILAEIKAQKGNEVYVRNNVLSATFNLEEGKDYKFTVEVRGKPGNKFKIDVTGAATTDYDDKEIELPKCGVDIVSGDIRA